MNRRASPAVIGGFVVGAVVLAVMAVAVFGSGRLFRRAYPFVLYFSGDVNGLKAGAAVKLKGVEIGSVTDIRLNIGTMAQIDNTPENLRIPVIVEIDEERFRGRGGKAHLGDPATIKRAIEVGLRGQLAMESFVTGLLYVKLDLFADTTPQYFADAGVPYPEIPTVPTPLEEVQMRASQFLAKLDQIDFAGIAASIGSAVKGVDTLVNSPRLKSAIDSLDTAIASLSATADSVRELADEMKTGVAPLGKSLEQTSDDAGTALREARATLEQVRAGLTPDAPVWYQLRTALEEVQTAAQAVRGLAEYLERNPGALLRGKPAREENP